MEIQRSDSPLAGLKQPAPDSRRDGVCRGLTSAQVSVWRRKREGIAQDGPAPSEEQLSRLAGISRAGPRQVEQRRLRTAWLRGPIRSTSGSPGDRLKVTRIQELLEARGMHGVIHVVAPVQYGSATGDGAASARCGWPTPIPARWPRCDFGTAGDDHRSGHGQAQGGVGADHRAVVLKRHCFVWPTHSQKLEDVIAGLEAAWAFFGGVPRYLVIDNFPVRGGWAGCACIRG